MNSDDDPILLTAHVERNRFYSIGLLSASDWQRGERPQPVVHPREGFSWSVTSNFPVAA